MRFLARKAITALAVAGLAFVPSSAAAGGPDAYDTALLKTLAGQSKMLDTIFLSTSGAELTEAAVTARLKSCGRSMAGVKDPAVAFALPILLAIPAMFEEIARHRQEIASVRDVVAGFRPHSAVFQEYVTATVKQADAVVVLARSLDPKKIDACGLAGAFLRSKGQMTEAQMFALLGVSPSTASKLAGLPELPKALTKRWNAFVRSSGLPASTMSHLLES
jgi:hypothetical protein